MTKLQRIVIFFNSSRNQAALAFREFSSVALFALKQKAVGIAPLGQAAENPDAGIGSILEKNSAEGFAAIARSTAQKKSRLIVLVRILEFNRVYFDSRANGFARLA